MALDPKKKQQAQNAAKQNVIESIKDLASAGTTGVTDMLQNTSEDFFNQLLGRQKIQGASGELQPGQSLKFMTEADRQAEENKKLRAQIQLERNMSADSKRLDEQKIGQLRVHLQALMSEVVKLSNATAGLAEETKIASMEVPVNPGVYHISFFEKLISFMQSFRKKIELASVWLSASNGRREKKNYWAMYKKKGASFLLSGEHYSQRSAG